MISKPTNQQLIEAVCAELTGKVAPNITDAGTSLAVMALRRCDPAGDTHAASPAPRPVAPRGH